MSAALARSGHVIEVDFRGVKVRREGDYLHATDMWRACGSDPSRKPYEWFRQKGTRELLAAAEGSDREGAALSVRSDAGAGSAGRGGNTWLHKRIAIAYACYLDPDFHLFVIDQFLDVAEGRSGIVRAEPSGDLSATQIALIDRVADRIAAPIVGALIKLENDVGAVAAEQARQAEAQRKLADEQRRLAEEQARQSDEMRLNRLAQEQKRRRLTNASKDDHRDAVAIMGGRCPCCFTTTIVIDGKAHGAEFDHFYASNQPDVEHTWLICKPCHAELTRGIAQRTERDPMFKAYQAARRRLPGRQHRIPQVA